MPFTEWEPWPYTWQGGQTWGHTNSGTINKEKRWYHHPPKKIKINILIIACWEEVHHECHHLEVSVIWFVPCERAHHINHPGYHYPSLRLPWSSPHSKEPKGFCFNTIQPFSLMASIQYQLGKWLRTMRSPNKKYIHLNIQSHIPCLRPQLRVWVLKTLQSRCCKSRLRMPGFGSNYFWWIPCKLE